MSTSTIYVISVQEDCQSFRGKSIDPYSKLENALEDADYESVEFPFNNTSSEVQQSHFKGIREAHSILLVFGSGSFDWFYSHEIGLRKWYLEERSGQDEKKVEGEKLTNSDESDEESRDIKKGPFRKVLLIPSIQSANKNKDFKEKEYNRKKEFLAYLGILDSAIINLYDLESVRTTKESWNEVFKEYLVALNTEDDGQFVDSLFYKNLRVGRSPFPGLQPFRMSTFDTGHSGSVLREQGHEDVFFGRDYRHVKRMIYLLASHNILFVVGGPGVGKTSLVNCGLIPALHAGFMIHAGPYWKTIHFRPQLDPIENLKKALERVIPEQKNEEARELQGVGTKSSNISEESIVERFSRVRKSGKGDFEVSEQFNLLICVDQFEELFFNEGNATAAQEIVDYLLAARNKGRTGVYVVFTLRSDFIGPATQFKRLSNAINDSLFLMPDMDQAELRNAITLPLRLWQVDPPVEAIEAYENEYDQSMSNLPFLQYALAQAWKTRSSQTFSHISISTAIDTEAQNVYESLENKAACELFFKCISEKGTGVKGFRRLVMLNDLDEFCSRVGPDKRTDVATHLIEDFFGPQGMSIVSLHPGTGSVKLSYDSVIDKWKTLAEWAQEESEMGAVYEELKREHKAYGSEARITGNQLRRAKKWIHTPNASRLLVEKKEPETNKHIKDIVNKSVQDERLKSLLKWGLVALGVVLFLGIVAAMYFINEQGKDLMRSRALATSFRAEQMMNGEEDKFEGKRLANVAFQLSLESEGLLQNHVHQVMRKAYNLTDVEASDATSKFAGSDSSKYRPLKRRDPVPFYVSKGFLEPHITGDESNSVKRDVPFPAVVTVDTDAGSWVAGYIHTPDTHQPLPEQSLIYLWNEQDKEEIDSGYVEYRMLEEETELLKYPGRLESVQFLDDEIHKGMIWLFAAGNNGVRVWPVLNDKIPLEESLGPDCVTMVSTYPQNTVNFQVEQADSLWLMAYVDRSDVQSVILTAVNPYAYTDPGTSCVMSPDGFVPFSLETLEREVKDMAFQATSDSTAAIAVLSADTSHSNTYLQKWDLSIKSDSIAVIPDAYTAAEVHTTQVDADYVMLVEDHGYEYVITAGERSPVSLWASNLALLNQLPGSNAILTSLDYVLKKGKKDSLFIAAGTVEGEVAKWDYLPENQFLNERRKRVMDIAKFGVLSTWTVPQCMIDIADSISFMPPIVIDVLELFKKKDATYWQDKLEEEGITFIQPAEGPMYYTEPLLLGDKSSGYPNVNSVAFYNNGEKIFGAIDELKVGKDEGGQWLFPFFYKWDRDLKPLKQEFCNDVLITRHFEQVIKTYKEDENIPDSLDSKDLRKYRSALLDAQTVLDRQLWKEEVKRGYFVPSFPKDQRERFFCDHISQNFNAIVK